MSEPTRWSCVAAANYNTPGGSSTGVTLFSVRAASRDEAVGKASRIARKLYPGGAGWINQVGFVERPEFELDPDGEITAISMPGGAARGG